MKKDKLKQLVLEQNKKYLLKDEIKRAVFDNILKKHKQPFVVIISGIRRCGKSTLIKQIRNEKNGYYLNFDDDRLVNFAIEDFQNLYEILIELYGDKEIFYFDEIQNILGWERFVRRLHDQGKKVYITGSNASMLSKELGTHLTGRNIEINLFPFSFSEYLNFEEIGWDKDSVYKTPERAKLKKYFKKYLIEGGLPEYLFTKNKEYLKSLYENVLYRDIIVRYKLGGEKAIKELVYLAANNIAKEISFNSIKKLLRMGSPTTVKEYFGYLENSFLMFLVPRYNYSLKKQINSNKKLYLIDNALAINLGFSFSENSGKLLENLVFIELKRRNKEIFYFQEKGECNFILREKNKIQNSIQVCYELTKQNKERELNGLIEAMNEFKLKEGLILTYDDEDEFKIDGKKIKVIPVWKWLLSNTESS